MNFREVEQYRNAHVIDEVILDFASQKEYEKWCTFLLDSGLTVHVCIEDLMNDLPNAFIERIGDLTVLSASNSVANPGKLIIKRLMDIGGSIVGLAITGIAFVIFAPIIKIQSPGPVFYSQIRVGRNGRQFRIYKFRSMYPDADARKEELLSKNKMDGQMFKMDDDPRIIPIGHFIRRHSVDELPQFWNVLKGDMSLVGTRPPTLDEWEKYSPHHRARMSMKPGLTGKWQVSGRSDITDFEEIVRLDTEYINNWSILTDLKLIGRTIFVVFRGDGAA
jgi:exopolysaccharide biosynthesis polyprenyl glycosylphosphotransferase